MLCTIILFALLNVKDVKFKGFYVFKLYNDSQFIYLNILYVCFFFNFIYHLNIYLVYFTIVLFNI